MKKVSHILPTQIAFKVCSLHTLVNHESKLVKCVRLRYFVLQTAVGPTFFICIDIAPCFNTQTPACVQVVQAVVVYTEEMNSLTFGPGGPVVPFCPISPSSPCQNVIKMAANLMYLSCRRVTLSTGLLI